MVDSQEFYDDWNRSGRTEAPGCQDQSYNALHIAASTGDLPTLKQLLDEGCSVNRQNFDRVSPLHEAAINGRADCVRLLISYGALVNAQNIDGSTPLCDACAKGCVESAKLLLDAGADVNPLCLVTTPLHEGALRGHIECVEILLEHGAQLEANDCHLGTALHAACYNNHHECAEALLQRGARVNAIKWHVIPLHYAVHNNNAAMVMLLLSYGADTRFLNHQWRSSYELANSNDMRVLIKRYEAHPRRLQSLCRTGIRHALGPARLHNIKQLHLPPAMLRYLQYHSHAHV